MMYRYFSSPLGALAAMVVALTLGAGSTAALAQKALVQVDGAWIRVAVQGQSGTGAFMSLTARESTRLVGVSTPVAGVAEVHEMRMDGDIMRMRAVPALELAAGKTVQLRPGSYHVMLMDLKAPLKTGTVVPVTLLLENAKGVASKVELKVPVMAAAPVAARPPSADSTAAGHDLSKHKH
ncbi:MAG: copper chaperone PCu(A)C [Polaromonas sp.]|nr:copper chaperone PCu(A)C [Polaromonas sp.]